MSPDTSKVIPLAIVFIGLLGLAAVAGYVWLLINEAEVEGFLPIIGIIAIACIYYLTKRLSEEDP